MRSTAATVLVLATGCVSGGSRNPILDSYPAGVTGNTTVIYYEVHGSTLDALRADLRRFGPQVDGRTFVGETRSPMRWSWRTEPVGTSFCAIRSVTVSVNARITLPRWFPPEEADPALITEWKRFLTALETHEAGHKDISARAARDIVHRLNGFSDLCSLIGTRANELARGIAERTTAEQSEYDRTTRHGFTQGTALSAPVTARKQ
jgi:predicted secreted Zn-dependent protease